MVFPCIEINAVARVADPPGGFETNPITPVRRIFCYFACANTIKKKLPLWPGPVVPPPGLFGATVVFPPGALGRWKIRLPQRSKIIEGLPSPQLILETYEGPPPGGDVGLRLRPAVVGVVSVPTATVVTVN
jgi:hypothetical protein